MVFNPLNPGEDRDPCANPVPEALSRPGRAGSPGPTGTRRERATPALCASWRRLRKGPKWPRKQLPVPAQGVGGAPAAGPSPGPRLTCVPRGSHRSVGRKALWPRIRDTALWTPMLGPLQPQAVGGGEGAPQPQRPTPRHPAPQHPAGDSPSPAPHCAHGEQNPQSDFIAQPETTAAEAAASTSCLLALASELPATWGTWGAWGARPCRGALYEGRPLGGAEPVPGPV